MGMKRYIVTLELIIDANEQENVEIYISDRVDADIYGNISIEETNVDSQDPDIVIDEED